MGQELSTLNPQQQDQQQQPGDFNPWAQVCVCLEEPREPHETTGDEAVSFDCCTLNADETREEGDRTLTDPLDITEAIGTQQSDASSTEPSTSVASSNTSNPSDSAAQSDNGVDAAPEAESEVVANGPTASRNDDSSVAVPTEGRAVPQLPHVVEEVTQQQVPNHPPGNTSSNQSPKVETQNVETAAALATQQGDRSKPGSFSDITVPASEGETETSAMEYQTLAEALADIDRASAFATENLQPYELSS